VKLRWVWRPGESESDFFGDSSVPIYEFKCAKCRHQFEALCRIGSNGRGLACPRCSSKRLQRLMSTFAARSGGRPGGAAAASAGGCAGCSSRSCNTCH
jgi:putative FmdB family regulatory protein